MNMRQVKPDDEPFLLEVYATTRSDELDAWGWDDAQRKQFIDMQFNAQKQTYQMQFPDADHQIILHDNQPVGRLLTQRSDQEIRLIDISLLTQHRNAGIGSRLLKDLLQEATDLRVPLRMSVSKTNPAKRLYDRLGFVVTAEDDMYFEMEANYA